MRSARKDNGVYKINRLRDLHIIEAELNLKRRELIARRLIQNAEAYNMIPMNNCGGWSGKIALDVVMLKYFTLSTCKQQRKNCALTDWDESACYDRIIPKILYLCYGKMDLPIDDCQWLARALVNMEYKVFTTHDPSEKISKTDSNGPIFRIGQGATDASAG